MAAVNVPDFRDNSLTPPPPERNTIGKGAQRQTRQGSTAKNLPSLSANKRTADQKFHDAPSELAPDSQLQNEVAKLERQVLEAKKAAFQRQFQTLTTANPAPPTEEPAANPREVRNSNFGLFYEHEVVLRSRLKKKIGSPQTQIVLSLFFEPFTCIHRSLFSWPPRAISYNFS